jgi:hypothetical protein
METNLKIQDEWQAFRFSVRFGVFTAVIMKNALFWDVTLCGSCKNRRFGEMYHLYHQGDKNRQARRQYVPPKHWFLQESHGITSQKMAFFIQV